MVKKIVSYFKWAPFALLLALAVTLSMRSSTANDQPAPDTVVPVRTDLASEERVLGKYLEDLTAYEQECRLIGKRARIANSDLESVQRRAADLKNRLSEVQNSVREVIRKLKAANEWDDLNALVAARISDPNQRREFQESNFKRQLEDASNGLASHGNEIGAPLESLRRRVVSRTFSPNDHGALTIVPAAYRPETPSMFLVSVKCMIAGIRRGLIESMGNKQNHRGNDLQSCACNPQGGIGIGTGTPCAECC